MDDKKSWEFTKTRKRICDACSGSTDGWTYEELIQRCKDRGGPGKETIRHEVPDLVERGYLDRVSKPGTYPLRFMPAEDNKRGRFEAKTKELDAKFSELNLRAAQLDSMASDIEEKKREQEVRVAEIDQKEKEFAVMVSGTAERTKELAEIDRLKEELKAKELTIEEKKKKRDSKIAEMEQEIKELEAKKRKAEGLAELARKRALEIIEHIDKGDSWRKPRRIKVISREIVLFLPSIDYLSGFGYDVPEPYSFDEFWTEPPRAFWQGIAGTKDISGTIRICRDAKLRKEGKQRIIIDATGRHVVNPNLLEWRSYLNRVVSGLESMNQSYEKRYKCFIPSKGETAFYDDGPRSKRDRDASLNYIERSDDDEPKRNKGAMVDVRVREGPSVWYKYPEGYWKEIYADIHERFPDLPSFNDWKERRSEITDEQWSRIYADICDRIEGVPSSNVLKELMLDHGIPFDEKLL